MPKGKVLSFQSCVVSSYVGAKVASLVLQTRGFDVDSLYAVIFSNHIGYWKVSGGVEDESFLQDIYNGLKHNRLNNYDYVISGYMKRDNFVNFFSEVVQDLKRQNSNLVYFFDPVLGDNGKFYCPESLVDLYKKELLPIADIITPNQFEAEKLSGITIKSNESAIMACHKLHYLGTKMVIISSIEGLSNSSQRLTCVLSELNKRDNYTEVSTVFIDFPKFEEDFIGAGDCFTALMIPAFNSKGFTTSFCEKIGAVCQALTHMHKILERSISICSEKNSNTVDDPSIILHKRYELALSDCVDILLDESVMDSLFDISNVVTTKL